MILVSFDLLHFYLSLYLVFSISGNLDSLVLERAFQTISP